MSNYTPKLKHIVYDIDDVLGDFWKTALPLFNNQFGSKDNILKIEDIKSFNGFLDSFHTNKDEFLDFVKNTVPMVDLEPTPYIHLMNRQYDKGHKISVVTSRDYIPDADAMTRSWLSKVGANYHDLHISGQKKKSEFFSVGDVGLVYEDHHENIDDYFNSGVLVGLGVIVDKPWNQSYKRESVIRQSWKGTYCG